MDTGPGQQDAVYRFAGFALDPVRAALRGPDGTAIELRPKSYAVLLHLVRNPGRLVTREALLDAVWPDVAVGDEALTQCVRDVPSGTPTLARPNSCSGATKRRWRPSAAASTAGGRTTGPPCWG